MQNQGISPNRLAANGGKKFEYIARKLPGLLEALEQEGIKPTLEELSFCMACHSMTVIKAIKHLEKRGILIVNRRQGNVGNSYRVAAGYFESGEL